MEAAMDKIEEDDRDTKMLIDEHPWTDDPRPDIKEDGPLWEVLFVIAMRDCPDVLPDLRFVRASGCVLRMENTYYVIRYPEDDEIKTGITEDEYHDFKENELSEHKSNIEYCLKVLRQEILETDNSSEFLPPHLDFG
jgi:hypothetical protein